MADFVNAGKLSDYEDGEARVTLIPGQGAVAVIQIDGQFYAFSNYCTHEGVNLANAYGDIAGTSLICMMHNATFDLATGRVLGGPASEPLPLYQVRIEGEDIFVGKGA